MVPIGTAFLLPSGDTKHLYFVITEPLDGNVIIVGVTSSQLEEEFVLNKGDHPSIRYKSYINCGKAERIAVRELEWKLSEGIYIKQYRAKRKTVEKICNGILKSNRTKPRIEKFYKRFIKHKEQS